MSAPDPSSILERMDALQRFKFSVEDFYALAATGVFADRHVELLDGDVIEMTINPPHAKAVMKLQKVLEHALGERSLISTQNPLDLGERATLPEPDLMVIKRLEYLDTRGRDRHPRPEDVFLLVEVADTTLSLDQTIKLEAYARNGVTEYWIADLNARTWYVHREPVGDTYRLRLTYRFGEAFAPSAFPDAERVWL